MRPAILIVDICGVIFQILQHIYNYSKNFGMKMSWRKYFRWSVFLALELGRCFLGMFLNAAGLVYFCLTDLATHPCR